MRKGVVEEVEEEGKRSAAGPELAAVADKAYIVL